MSIKETYLPDSLPRDLIRPIPLRPQKPSQCSQGRVFLELTEDKSELTKIFSRAHEQETNGDIRGAEKLYRVAAGRGHYPSMCNLGMLFLRQRKMNDAQFWLEQAAQHGDCLAENNLGCFYEEQGLVEKAEEVYRSAAGKGSVDAMFNLAVLLQTKRGKTEESVTWYRKAAERGYQKAQLNLAPLVEDREAIILYKAAAKGSGHSVKAMYNLAQLYEKKGDICAAIEWYACAGDNGDVQGYISIATFFEKRKSFKIATEWLEKAVRVCNDPQIMFRLGLLFEQLPDEGEAVKWYERAFERGESAAACNLAVFWEAKGELKKAEQWYTAAARYDNEDALFNLGRILISHNRSVEAIPWLKRGAELGDADCQCSLGAIFEEQGQLDEALRLYKQGADQGDANSRANYDELWAKLHKRTQQELLQVTLRRSLPPKKRYVYTQDESPRIFSEQTPMIRK